MQFKNYSKLVNITKKEHTHRYREETGSYHWEEGEGHYRDGGKRRYKLLGINRLEDVLYSTGIYQYFVITVNEK